MNKEKDCNNKQIDQFMDGLFQEYLPVKDNLIQILNEVQEHFGYIPKESQTKISEFLKIPMAEIYGVITFYSRFTLKPKGKYNIWKHAGEGTYTDTFWYGK